MCPITFGHFSECSHFSRINSTKYMMPQTMKVQLAPCHKPVKNHTKNRLLSFSANNLLGIRSSFPSCRTRGIRATQSLVFFNKLSINTLKFLNNRLQPIVLQHILMPFYIIHNTANTYKIYLYAKNPTVGNY